MPDSEAFDLRQMVMDFAIVIGALSSGLLA
jgi:hypothetical protein